MNRCGLCGENKSLRKSHIIPKFVFDWIKKTGTGALRSVTNINIRTQDGPKFPFLCHDCEQLFSKSEKYSANIFHDIVNDAESFTYNFEFRYFAFSVLWRLLKSDVIINEKDCIFYDLLQTAEIEWRNFLLNGEVPPTFNELHLFVTVDPLRDEDIKQHNIIVPDKFVQYMGRMTDGGLADGDDRCMMYFKLPRMLFIAPIIGFNKNLYHNTELDTNGGTFQVDECFIGDEAIGGFLIERAKLMGKKFGEISNNQRELLRNRTKQKLNEIENKDLGRILRYNESRYNDESN